VTANASAKRGSRSLTVTASGGGITHSAGVTVTVQ
jgi:hypothetical protein